MPARRLGIGVREKVHCRAPPAWGENLVFNARRWPSNNIRARPARDSNPLASTPESRCSDGYPPRALQSEQASAQEESVPSLSRRGCRAGSGGNPRPGVGSGTDFAEGFGEVGRRDQRAGVSVEVGEKQPA